MIRYREGMTDSEMQKLLSSVEELDVAYARAAVDIAVVSEEDEASEQAAWYDELNREYNRNRS